VTVETFDFDAPLRVTPAASEHFRSSLASAGKAGVRISVQESGCTGFKYVMQEVDAGEVSDTAMPLDNGVTLFVDADAVEFLRGTELDLSREGINKVLKFNNPNVVAECGCGESFSVG
jgi:iron-sulfur cluster assembly accessory protein